jgi:hypothetical protein
LAHVSRFAEKSELTTRVAVAAISFCAAHRIAHTRTAHLTRHAAAQPTKGKKEKKTEKIDFSFVFGSLSVLVRTERGRPSTATANADRRRALKVRRTAERAFEFSLFYLFAQPTKHVFCAQLAVGGFFFFSTQSNIRTRLT